MSFVDDVESNPYAAPKGAPGALGNIALANVEYAGFWVRFVAVVIDGIVLFVLNLIVSFAIIFAGVAMKMDPVIAWLISCFFSAIIQIGYFPLMHSAERQATYGKLAMGIKVTDLRGRRITFGRALGREFAKFLSAIIFLIGYIMAAFTERKQTLHDMIAGTLVIKA
ncbi:Uncharacterized membrane protein YckC, RDD family [Singulisphaera sp. GP187]|uniref:RDD family protein n=1 Tax=Singulisphaera sp. GP187 TaxID=1882752 RepID=UPI00092714BA|nr:RDD family protein [Singulisphaera sp. GP187]SIN76158.1 Uncharacterized membrane protein YckC, RDD family [Singulisphaera sp. GP187]